MKDASGRRTHILPLLTIAYALSMLDRTIISLMIVPLQRDLGLSDTDFALLSGFAFSIMFTCLGIPMGWLSDRVQRRRLIAVGIALWSLMTLLSAFARDYNQLLLARIGVGIGEATLAPAAVSLLSDLFSRDRVARAIGTFNSGAHIGTAASFLIGGPLVGWLSTRGNIALPLVGEVRGWQIGFLVAGLPGIIVAWLMLQQPEPPRRVSGEAVTSAGETMSFMPFWRAHGANLATLVFGTAIFLVVTYAYTNWTVPLLIRSIGLTTAQAGLIMGAIVIVAGPAGFVSGGILADRWSARGVENAGIKVCRVASGLTLAPAVLGPLTNHVAGIAICLFLYQYFSSFVYTAAVSVVQQLAPVAMRGRILAIYYFTINLTAIGFGPLSVSLLVDYVFRDKASLPQAIAIVAAACISVALVLFFRAGRSRPTEAGTASLAPGAF